MEEKEILKIYAKNVRPFDKNFNFENKTGRYTISSFSGENLSGTGHVFIGYNEIEDKFRFRVRETGAIKELTFVETTKQFKSWVLAISELVGFDYKFDCSPMWTI